MSAAPAIGGFFGLHGPTGGVAPDRSLLAAWTAGGAGWVGFHNARSALGWLVRSLRPPVVWLPRYLCRDMREAAGNSVRLYDVDAGLRLADRALAADLAAGDLVVTVAYFGAPVCDDLRQLAARRADAVWVEDRAQALLVDAADAVPGAWHLYSPRKLLGVADGGILVGSGLNRLPPPELAAPPPGHAEAAELRVRAADRAELAAAYRRYLEIERGQGVAVEC